MESTDSHDAQVQVPSQATSAGPFEPASNSIDRLSENSSDSEHRDKPGVFVAGAIVGSSYEVIELLGRGAMGMVYRVKHVTLPAEYALKILTADKHDEVSVIRFQNEAQAIAKLNHPNIVSIYNFGVHEGCLPFYVMDLLEGEDLLDKVVFAGPMGQAEALPLFIEACAGLSYAHRKGILHRDVKPANLLILDKADVHGARVKVVDFGIVKFADELKPDAQKLTAMGIVCGSPSYMSPEQATGQKVDPRSDIYSLGCSLFEALTGKVPYRGRSASETMMMHVSTPSPSLASKNPEGKFSYELEIVVAKMMAKEPMYRYQTMEAAAQDLKNVLVGTPLGTSPISLSQLGAAPSDGVVTLRLGAGENRFSNLTSRPEELFEDERESIDENYDDQDQLPDEDIGDDLDDEETNDEIGMSNTAKIAAIAIVAVLTIAIAAYFVWPVLYPSARPGKNTVTVGNSSQVTELKLESNDLNKELHLDDVSSDPDDGADLTSVSSAKYFSKDITEHGQQFVQFDFPAKACNRPLAWVGTSRFDRVNAEGTVKFPKKSKVYLLPSPNALKKPQFFEKFRPGDIEYVYVFPPFANDRLVELSMSIPGIKVFSIAGCPGLTTKIIPALDRLTGLSTLMVAKTSMDGSELAKSSVWKKVTNIYLSQCKNVHPVLKKLSGSTKLVSLDVSDNDLDSEDYKLISNLPRLQNLVLNDNKITVNDLRVLSRLPSLTALSIVNIHLKQGSASKELQHFPALKTLVVDRGHFRKQDLAYLKEHVPNLRVIFYAPAPSMFAGF